MVIVLTQAAAIGYRAAALQAAGIRQRKFQFEFRIQTGFGLVSGNLFHELVARLNLNATGRQIGQTPGSHDTVDHQVNLASQIDAGVFASLVSHHHGGKVLSLGC
jgi:hypothetical protein